MRIVHHLVDFLSCFGSFCARQSQNWCIGQCFSELQYSASELGDKIGLPFSKTMGLVNYDSFHVPIFLVFLQKI